MKLIVSISGVRSPVNIAKAEKFTEINLNAGATIEQSCVSRWRANVTEKGKDKEEEEMRVRRDVSVGKYKNCLENRVTRETSLAQ